MLVLSRKPMEAVIVGGDDGIERLVKATVLEIAQGRVKLGFEVTADVWIKRLEANRFPLDVS